VTLLNASDAAARSNQVGDKAGIAPPSAKTSARFNLYSRLEETRAD
jgi:hypothetical protein